MKSILSFLIVSVLFISRTIACGGGAAPYLSGPFGSNTSAVQTSMGTYQENTTCNEAAIEFQFNITDAWKNESCQNGCGCYSRHEWWLNGSRINNSSATSVNIDPDNLSEGIQNLFVRTFTANNGANCSKTFYYNFGISKFTPLPDFQVVMDDTVLPGNKNLQQNTSINMRVAGNNRGDEPCSPSTSTSQVRIWWTDRSSNVYSSADDVLALSTQIGVTKGTTINWETHNIGVPLISQFPSAGSFASVRLIAEIDYNNTITESKENNNTYVISSISIVNNSGGRLSEGSGNELANLGKSPNERGDEGPFKIVDLSGKTVWEKSSGIQLDYNELHKYKILVQFSRLNGEVTKEKIIIN